MKFNAVVVLFVAANAAQAGPIGMHQSMLSSSILPSFFLPIRIQRQMT